MKKLLTRGCALLTLSLLAAGCSNHSVDHQSMGHGEHKQENQKSEVVTSEDGKKVFRLEVKETHWMFNDEIMTNAWTYNGSLPGQEIRVTEGDTVLLQVKNSLEEPTALHLHGLPIPNEMDGVPGVTQNAIMPGEEFTYEYKANVPGTYWYHSHQDGAKQVDKGLYGVFIVEPNEAAAYDVDEVIVIDEYASMGMDEMDHSGMDHSNAGHGHNAGSMITHTDMMNDMYDTMIINGKASPKIESIRVEEGNTLKLRFVNAGLYTQVVSIPNHPFTITHYDGQPVHQPDKLSDTAFRIAPGERYDVEIEMNYPGAWGIDVFAEENKAKLNVQIPLVYEGFEGEHIQTSEATTSFFDFTTYGKAQALDFGAVTKSFDMILGTNDGGETFTINDKLFPNHESFEVEEGDVVKFTIVNDTEADHPMHMHGEFFHVISKDGIPVSGSQIMKDTLNVRPGETYEVLFQAKNPGIWMFHCHEFHHANAGMMAEVRYTGFEASFTPDPNVPNKPE